MGMETIVIDFDVHKKIEAERTTFDDTPNDVLRRLFKLPIKKTASIDNQVGPTKAGQTTGGFYTKGVFFANGTKLRNISRGITFNAEIKDGKVFYNGENFPSLSSAACKATGVSTNGWLFWLYLDDAKDKWVTCDNRRK